MLVMTARTQPPRFLLPTDSRVHDHMTPGSDDCGDARDSRRLLRC